MALKKQTFTKAGEKGYSLKLVLTEESTNVTDNTSLVSYAFSILRTNYGVFSSQPFSWNIAIAGQTIQITNFKFQISTDDPPEQLIKSGKITVAHASDGAKTIDFNVSTPDVSSIGPYAPKAMQMTGKWTLTTIPRASTISALDVDIGSSTLITVSRASAAFTHTITYIFGEKHGIIATKSKDTSIPWSITPDEDFLLQIPNSKYGTAKLTCQTYSGGDLIGETSTTIRITAPEAIYKPSVTGALDIIDETTESLTDYQAIRYISTIAATIKCDVAEHATLVRCAINGVDIPNPEPGKNLTIQFERAEAWHYVFEAWDSRGYYNSTYMDIDMHPYIPLTCTPQISRDEPTKDKVTVTCKGNFWNSNFSSERANKLYLTVQYVEKGKSNWSTATKIPATVTDNTYTATLALTGLSYLNAYDFRIYAQDEAMHFTLTGTLSKGVPVFDWGERTFNFNVPISVHGTSLRVDSAGGTPVLYLSRDDKNLGGIALSNSTNRLYLLSRAANTGKTENYVIDPADPDLSATKSYYLLTSKIAPDYVVAQGSSGGWAYRKWASGRAECWGVNVRTVTNWGTNEWGGIYNCANVSLPFAFTAITIAIANVSCGNLYAPAYGDATEIQTNSVATFNCNVPVTGSKTFKTHMLIHGRWK